MTLPDSFLERLKQANDIVTVMSGHAELKRAGRDFVCLCPFHSEKTESCHVYTDNQSFYCFGCSKGGSVITFIQLTQNLDYMAAVQLLAERSGIPMPDDDRGEEGKEELRRRSRIYEMNKEAARFFRDCLLAGENAGSAFYRERGLTANTVRKYGLGYAPDSWNALKQYMNTLGYYDDELLQASLLRRNEKGNIYDMFRDRAMFPIIDRTGKVIAFSGRLVNDEGFGGKYVNSTDTPVYRKGENIFSINFAKNSKSKTIILCEGNIDAVMLNQAGFDNTVAILGTALTSAQARLLRYYCDDVVIAYDADAAGENATMKAINLLNREGMSARVLQLSGANDPDEFIKKFGTDSFKALINKSGSAISFELDKLKRSVDIDSSAGKAEYLKKAIAFLSGVDNRLDRMVYIPEVAFDCGITTEGVTNEVEVAIKSKLRYDEREETRNLIQHGTLQRVVPKSHGEQTIDTPEDLQIPTAVFRAEECITAYLFHSPDKLATILRNLSPDDFSGTFSRRLFETLILRLNKRQSIDRTALGSEFSALEMGRIEKIRADSAETPFTNERLTNIISVLLKYKESKNTNTAEMTDDELLAYTESLKEKKSIKTR
jgi:DNA primase